MQQKNVRAMAARFGGRPAGVNPLRAKHKKIAARGSRTVFPPPGHNHDRCSAEAMAHAEALCAGRGERLTPIRRQVLETLAAHHRPLGAYEVIDRLAEKVKRLAPITVYRALDFLVENGLVHRIESRNAFLACVNNHQSSDMVVFLICERCGSVGEAPSSLVAETLTAAARAAGFTPRAPVIEISGLCTHCRDAA
jgi:Fur family zinc uptake transcriptional regulator